jgi:hypothetical protein
MTILVQRQAVLMLLILLIGVPFIGGCETKEEIRTYRVEKEKKPQPPVAASTPTNEIEGKTDRMLGAIIPAGEQSWFFKVTGPGAIVDKNAAKINEFFQTIELSAGADKPVWRTPEGWEELGPSGMRAATLKIPNDSQPLEISVIPSSGTLIDNVNRWRGQLQLPPIDEAALASTVKEAKAGDAKMWLVDLSGKASPGGMMAPFANQGRPPAPAAVPGAPQPTDLPPGHPPIAGEGLGKSAGDAPFEFVAPESWQPQPVSGMRKAAFMVKDGDKQADITVIDLLASAPSVADPLENVNRWRGEIGLAPIDPEQLKTLVQKIEIDGKPGDYVELVPDAAKPAESQAGEATFAAAVPAGRMIWFFKMRGDRELVVAQREHFKSFLESIRFVEDGGAGDGN